jgi:ER membrane protein complex subunit 2
LYTDLALPTEGTVEALHELATAKLAELVRTSSSGDKSSGGYDPAELIAAKELLDQETKNLQR